MNDFQLNYTALQGAPSLVPAIELEHRLDVRLRPRNSEVNDARFLVHIHAFFMDQCRLLLKHLEVSCPNADLLITTTSVRHRDELAALVRSTHAASFRRNVEIMLVANRGRNVRPLLVDIRRHMVNYPYVLHLHTKESRASGFGSEWFGDLIDCLVGSREHVRMITTAFASNPKLGVVMPRTGRAIRPYANWGGNFEMAQLLCNAVFPGRLLMVTAPLVFPAGMMFWFRPEALQGLCQMADLWSDAPYEPLPIDGSSLHAMERLVAHACEAVGYEWSLCAPESDIQLFEGVSAVHLSVWEPRHHEYIQATAMLAARLRQIEYQGVLNRGLRFFLQRVVSNFNKRLN